MSYENTSCPCGDKKQPNTMLCAGCETEFADHPCMRAFKATSGDLETRRHAANTLVTLARDRNKRRASA